MTAPALSRDPSSNDAQAGPLPVLAGESFAVLLSALAGRLNRGASSFYQRRYGFGMSEFRILLTLSLADGLNVGEVARAADIDKAAGSRSLRLLQERGHVAIQQTPTRGRAAIVRLTQDGEALARDIRQVARQRNERLLSVLAPGERIAAEQILRKLIDGVEHMNKE